VPALLEARSNEAAVDLECGKKGDAVSIWKKLTAAAKPFAPALANLGYVSWQEGNKSDAESLFKRSIEADPWSGSIAARINMAQIYRETGSSRERVSEKKSLNDAAVKELRRVSRRGWKQPAGLRRPLLHLLRLGLARGPAKLVGAQASAGTRNRRPASSRMRRLSRMSRARKPRGQGKERRRRREGRGQDGPGDACGGNGLHSRDEEGRGGGLQHAGHDLLGQEELHRGDQELHRCGGKRPYAF